MKTSRSVFKKGDIILVAVIGIACAAMLLLRSASAGQVIAKIYIDGEVVSQIDLSSVAESYKTEIQGSVISVEPGRICYVESDCADELCVKRGWLSKAGDVAACVPNRTVISLSSCADEPHAVTY